MNAAAGDQTEQVSHVAAWRLECLSSEWSLRMRLRSSMSAA
jgi:hypothetical protein